VIIGFSAGGESESDASNLFYILFFLKEEKGSLAFLTCSPIGSKPLILLGFLGEKGW
jgi:hypothetical protein